MRIVVIDYGIGNVKSIINSFEKQNIEAILSRDEKVVLEADGLVLPGVGAFSHGMNNLNRYGLVPVIKQYVETDKPLLGICLGMQMLFERSEEFVNTEGIGLIKGSVIKLPIVASNKTKLPHISWNEINPKTTPWHETIMNDVKLNSNAYFVHTFVGSPENDEDILSVTNYHGVEFCSSIKHNNVYGCQFHPEKSGEIGLKIIANFIKICTKIG